MTQALEQLLLNPERTLPPIEVDGETGASEGECYEYDPIGVPSV